MKGPTFFDSQSGMYVYGKPTVNRRYRYWYQKIRRLAFAQYLYTVKLYSVHVLCLWYGIPWYTYVRIKSTGWKRKKNAFDSKNMESKTVIPFVAAVVLLLIIRKKINKQTTRQTEHNIP
jgi:hypothetical protein